MLLKFSLLSLLLCPSSLFLVSAVANAQSIAPAIDGTGSVVIQNGNAYNIGGGQLSKDGANLFQSFQRFNLNPGEIANFISNPAIQTILGRVVGGDPSRIDGLIRVSGGNSNLFLVNPAGILFGANASLNVPASFAATTANAIAFGKGQWFNAVGANSYANLVGNPTAFAFLTSQPGAILNAGNLAVGQGQTLTLLGGTVINTGTLTAPGGMISIAAVPGEKMVRLSQTGSVLDLDLPLAGDRPTPHDSLPTPLSLPALLTGGNLPIATGITVNPNGTVMLTSSSLPIQAGDVVTSHLATGTATLSAVNNLTIAPVGNLPAVSLQTMGDLNLVAGNTVQVRDSVTNPVLVQAGGNLTIQGNQSVDILALNHPGAAFQSGKNLTLISDGVISGDTRFASNGRFSVQTLRGAPGSLVSKYDPIISANDDVYLGNYSGASLKVESLGNILLDTVTITAPDVGLTGSDPDIPILTSGSALILRAGLTQLANPGSTGARPAAITDLGTLGGNYSYAYGINNSGQVVGVSSDAAGNARAFRTAPNAAINPLTDDLGTLGGNNSAAYGINNAGQVVGNSTDAVGNTRAFRTAPNAAINPLTDDLGTLGGNNSAAYGINNAGQVVGNSTDAVGNTRAFRTAPNAAINPLTDDLGTLGGNNSAAYGINNAGQVVGNSTDAVGNTRAFRTAPNAAINPLTDNLGTLGGNVSVAQDINDTGQVVGYSTDAAGNTRAFSAAPNAAINPLTDKLGTLGGNDSLAYGINNLGEIVGNSTDATGIFDPFLSYLKVFLYDLNSVVGYPGELVDAHDTNDTGQIVGNGVIGGQTRAFLFTRLPVVSSVSLGRLTVGRISQAVGDPLTVILDAKSDLQTSSITTNGGDIRLTSTNGNITTQSTLRTDSAAGGAGQIQLTAAQNITAAAISSSSNVGNAGDIVLSGNSDIQVSWIDAAGANSSGNITINAGHFFRVTDRVPNLLTGLQSLFSISTNGNITIRHGGGTTGIPFIVGDPRFNGTQGAITSGLGNAIFPVRSFPGSYIQGTSPNAIQIITADNAIQITTAYQVPCVISGCASANLINPLDQSNRQPPTTLETVQSGLREIQKSTGIRPAIIYVQFFPTPAAKSTVEDREAVLTQEFQQYLKRPLVSDSLKIEIEPSEKDQLELLLVTAEGEPMRVRVPNTSRVEVLATARKFRNETADPTRIRSARYLPTAQQLYQWMITPISADLQARGIQNLVFIMDAGLRTMPLAALHNGKEFLIERYSVGLMPSFSLTDTRYANIRDSKILAAGASTFTDAIPLPAAQLEISTITQTLWQGTSLFNERFTLNNLQEERQRRPFGIIHLATHGVFLPGNLNNSFIQLWDQKLGLNQLRELGWNHPTVELAVLSACNTAVGNEEAELGFAGLAAQAGVKSALASLWSVSDEGTLALMTEFYQQLKTAPIRAEALRRAQVAMLKGNVSLGGGRLNWSGGEIELPPELSYLNNRLLTHPYFWSAFTMVGSPW